MTLNNNPIDVYFHMRNHYKKLKFVKSVIDCCPPKKGRARTEKSPKSDTSSHSKQQNDRSKSASRPKTRRNPKETPRNKSKSAGRQDVSSSVKCEGNSYEQHEYLQFSLRITEDIIKNDLYDNEQMKKVLASHFEANKGRLDPEKMIAALYELCLELNIPITDTFEAETNQTIQTRPSYPKPAPIAPRNSEEYSYKCICTEDLIPDDSNPCICMMQRTPPIPCKVHPSACGMELTREETQQIIEAVNSVSSTVSEKKILEYVTNTSNEEEEEEEESEVKVLHAPRKKSTVQSIQSMMEGHMVCNCGSENCIADSCGGATLPDTFKITDFDIDDGDEVNAVVNERISEDSVIEAATYYQEVEIAEDSKIEIDIDTSQNNEEEEEQVEEEIKEQEEEQEEIKEKEEIKEEPPAKVIESRTLDCDLECLVMEYDKKMAHPRNMQMLNVSHYTSTIDPVRVKTCDLNIQTSLESIPVQCCVCGHDDEGNTVQKKLSVSRGTQSSAETNTGPQRVVIVPPKHVPKIQQPGNDFILLEGPVFIPKSVINKGIDVEKQRASSNHCDCGCQMHSYPSYSTVKTPSYTTNLYKPPCNLEPQAPFDYLIYHDRSPCEEYKPCRTSSLYNKPMPHYSRNYHECDITPQREISMYNNVNCKRAPNSSCCVRNDNHNLLLGNHYSRYSMGATNNMSYFYPTIATQVSSTDILNTQAKNESMAAKMKVENEEPPPERRFEVVEEIQVRSTHRVPSISKPSSRTLPPTDMQSVVLNKIKTMDNIAASDSTDSMDKRIQSLRMDMAKYKVGEIPVAHEQKSTSPENLPRERGVSISEEVELIKNYDLENTKNGLSR